MKLFFLDKTTPKPSNRTKPTKTHKKKCKFCGNMFETNIPNQIYCSGACRSANTLAESKKQAPPVIVREKKKNRTIDDYIAESEACGLSYGKYKAQLRLGKTYEELKAAYEERQAKAGVW